MSKITFLKVRESQDCLGLAKMAEDPEQRELAELLAVKTGCIEYNNTELEKFKYLVEQEGSFPGVEVNQEQVLMSSDQVGIV